MRLLQESVRLHACAGLCNKRRGCCSRFQEKAKQTFESTCASILHANLACLVQPMHNGSPKFQHNIKLSNSTDFKIRWPSLTRHTCYPHKLPHDHTVPLASKLFSMHHRFHLAPTGHLLRPVASLASNHCDHWICSAKTT